MFSLLTDPEEIFGLELLAIKYGIELALRHSSHSIWIESNSSYAVDIVKKSAKCPWNQINRVHQIHNLLEKFHNWKITHVWREGNTVADILSKRGFPAKREDFCMSVITPELQDSILKDSVGMIYARM
ncbi:uncharacterized protein LOC143850596 [Tasmannia lanceolata]|uniref:uncharacterized protein LOC143850596 n=1 Tax=Tasmannia lanceolata TaxID=3420 RepID=UPI0040636B4E